MSLCLCLNDKAGRVVLFEKVASQAVIWTKWQMLQPHLI
jgi:hypothetical protein